jgi:hypothetical protein
MAIRDGDWQLYEWDPVSGRSVWCLEDGDKTHFRVDYPAEATLSANTEARNAAAQTWKGDWHRIASVPLNIAHDSGLVEAQSQQDGKFLSKWLNDPDNRGWRTKEGKV